MNNSQINQNIENNQVKNKQNPVNIVLVLLIIVLVGYIGYGKFYSKKINNKQENKQVEVQQQYDMKSFEKRNTLELEYDDDYYYYPYIRN